MVFASSELICCGNGFGTIAGAIRVQTGANHLIGLLGGKVICGSSGTTQIMQRQARIAGTILHGVSGVMIMMNVGEVSRQWIHTLSQARQ